MHYSTGAVKWNTLRLPELHRSTVLTNVPNISAWWQCSSPLPGRMNCHCQRQLQKKFSKHSKPLHISWLGELSKDDREKDWELEITVFVETGKNVNIDFVLCSKFLMFSEIHKNYLVPNIFTVLLLHSLWLNCSISSSLWAKYLLWYVPAASHPFLGNMSYSSKSKGLT